MHSEHPTCYCGSRTSGTCGAHAVSRDPVPPPPPPPLARPQPTPRSPAAAPLPRGAALRRGACGCVEDGYFNLTSRLPRPTGTSFQKLASRWKAAWRETSAAAFGQRPLLVVGGVAGAESSVCIAVRLRPQTTFIFFCFPDNCPRRRTGLCHRVQGQRKRPSALGKIVFYLELTV